MNSIKNKFSNFFILSLLIIGFYSCSDDEIELKINEPLVKTEQLNVSYGDDNSQKYDIYLPANRTKLNTKTFILVHGGSWVSGDKNNMDYLVSMLQLNFPEYAIVNINYRLASTTRPAFPMQINDIEQVIEHLQINSETYQISNHLGFIGTSAGAHLSMLYSYKFDTSSNVDMVCSIVGPTNFTDTNYINNPNYSNFATAMQLITGVSYVDNPAYYEELSPYHVVTNTAPPTIFFYGGQDELIPTSQGIDMHAKLDELGVINEFTLYENEGHGWDGLNLLDTSTKLITFINSRFK